MQETITIKEHISQHFTNLTEQQLEKVLQAYFTCNWMNPKIDIFTFISFIDPLEF